MDTNDQKDVDLNNEEEVLELDIEESAEETNTEADAEPKQEKRQLTPAEMLAIHERKAKKLRKELGLETEEAKTSKEKAPKSGELGYAEKAFLFATGIKGSEETALVREFMENTGKSLEEVVDSKYFQAELKEMREAKASADAIPKGSKRSAVPTKDSVDYWLAKGELPPNEPEFIELRRKVVNARINRETDKNKFASSSTGRVSRQSQLKK